jgi:hypothetical protein
MLPELDRLMPSSLLTSNSQKLFVSLIPPGKWQPTPTNAIGSISVDLGKVHFI